jgi:hypothetical protein
MVGWKLRSSRRQNLILTAWLASLSEAFALSTLHMRHRHLSALRCDLLFESGRTRQQLEPRFVVLKFRRLHGILRQVSGVPRRGASASANRHIPPEREAINDDPFISTLGRRHTPNFWQSMMTLKQYWQSRLCKTQPRDKKTVFQNMVLKMKGRIGVTCRGKSKARKDPFHAQPRNHR